MVLYAAACEDCTFTFENACESTTRTVSKRHVLFHDARGQGHTVVLRLVRRARAPVQSHPRRPGGQLTMDFTVRNEGSLFLLTPVSEAGRIWVDEHIGPEATTWGAAVVVEHRYITDIVVALDADGYVVKEG